MHITNKLLLSIILFCQLAFAGVEENEKRIEFLLNAINQSKGTFYRSGESYPATKAHDHIKRKYRIGMLNPFSPSKEEWTAEFFIDNVASKSSSTGEDYFIDENGKRMKMKEWLDNKLKTFNKNSL
ncbi:DUF5329 family protein [Bacteriovorax sp. Seq25_V]|uniref:DUF5329 family protein n=1 Tax=Bacteriovorax sp. Seq25_V TaxID=1201288 RepID=UPI00038A25CF|nr:DUF5329 family protein [Bacteriovorax sp. Seq25_V]EQC44267.1 hypothetical protein M900_A0442 [Bacteriovorax sp. Seq25_V]